MKVSFVVNGQPTTVDVAPMARLLDVLREDLRLTGTKEGCGEGECGACSVLIDGVAVNSCIVPMVQVQGADIRTIEGIEGRSGLHPMQQTLLDKGGAQCGICTPGFVVAATALLEENPHPTSAQARQALAGNLCRCTGYQRIIDSVVEALDDDVPTDEASPAPSSEA